MAINMKNCGIWEDMELMNIAYQKNICDLEIIF